MRDKANYLVGKRVVALMREMIKKRLVLFVLLTLPIVLFCLSFIFTKNRLAPGDPDYLMQAYDAMRISILKFHQFPWWNSWVAGGVPLFANPQFGLFSIHTPLVLFFGASLGVKLTITVYFIIGFWGFRKLFIDCFKTPVLTATLLSYIWTFGTFLTERGGGGHYTFILIQLFPWALLFYMQRRKSKYSWLKLGLVLSLMANSATHYMTILSYVVLALFVLLECFKLRINKKARLLEVSTNASKKDLSFWLKTALVFLALTGYRLIFTLLYLKDYQRTVHGPENSMGILKALFAMFGPMRQFTNPPQIPLWSWLEASAYIGICTGIAALIVGYIFIQKRRNLGKFFSYSPYIILILIVLSFVLGLGDFMGKFSPYLLLRRLPVFSSMRVASRWLAWCSMFTLMCIAIYKGKRFRTVINLLLAISCIELFIYSRPHLAKPYFITEKIVRSPTSNFEQRLLYNTKRYGIPFDENLTEATDNNYGQIIAGDSLIDTRFPPPTGIITSRCSTDNGCNFVMTGNAKVAYWSPNKIILSRTGPGDIALDMNPGNDWLINKRYEFIKLKVTDPGSSFTIKSNDNTITLEYIPRFSAVWFWRKVF